jgi:hypothetical protein
MTKETLYLVAEIGYEYNDEIYHSGENNSVIPVVLYRDPQKAAAVAAQRTLNLVRTEELSHYGYSLEDILAYEHRRDKTKKRAFEDLMNKYDPEFDLGDMHGWDSMQRLDEVIKRMTEEDLVELLSYLNLKFFEVREVVLED